MKEKTINIAIFLCIIIIIAMIGFGMYSIFSYEKIEYPQEKLEKEDISIIFMPSESGYKYIFNLLENAKEEINCALRSLNYDELEELLWKKESEGVKVRLIVDKDYAGNKRIYKPFVRFTLGKEGMMHNNYCIIDKDIVMSGSTIFNKNTIDFNFHDSVIINSSELARKYNSNFWILFENQTYPNDNPDYINVGDSTIKVLFCPYHNCEEELVNQINKANEKIKFAIYAVTNRVVIDALRNASKRGVWIEGTYEKSGITDSSIKYAGIPGVQVDQFNRRVHTKLMIIDENISITGTLNPSWRGVTINNENVLIINNPEINNFYEDFIDYIYNFKKI
ncbi:MAG: phospholipase D-like domain-containing protein [Candidatus Woesearchaeota archaeon]